MRRVKSFVFILFFLFVIVTLLSLLIPSKVATVNALVINSPQTKILSQVADFKNWKNWHPVFKNNPSAVYSNPSTGVNAYVDWVSNNKKNRLQITEQTSQSVKFSLIRAGEKDVENFIAILPVENSIGLQVEWQVLTKLKWYPWEKFAGIFIEKIAGPANQEALESLRKYLESQP
ncbi:MAG: hypothetical protein ABI091_07690 [Ferruginibacter sp.]